MEGLCCCGSGIRFFLFVTRITLKRKRCEVSSEALQGESEARADVELGGILNHFEPFRLYFDSIWSHFDGQGFKDLSNFAYLTRSSCKTLKDVDDVEMFERRIHAMQTIGIPEDEMAQILRMVASVLHLGNIKFDAPPNNSEGPESQTSTRAKTH